MDQTHHLDEGTRRLINWAAARPDVRAVLLTSTRARPHGTVDRFSDYDPILVVEEIEPYVADRRWIADFGEVLVTYWDPVYLAPGYDLETGGNVIQYADGLKIDFTLWPVALLRQIAAEPELPPELDAGYAVLLDKDRLTSSLQPPTYRGYVPVPPAEDEFQRWTEEFLSNVPYVAKFLWRDELLPAKWCLDTDMKHKYLRRVLEWRAAIDSGWSQPVSGALGKGLMKRLPPELGSALEATYVGPGLDENWEALYQTIALFRKAASDVAEHLGYTYPRELEERVVRYARMIQRERNV
jgi:aminoglycoside 6-adenylyltransferase